MVTGSSSNLSGVAPSVIRINDGGSPDGAGTHLRISGNNQTADSNNKGSNGPSSSKNSDGGIEVAAGNTFRLPAIDVTVVAGAAGSTVQPKLRATDGDSGSFNSPKNAFTFLQYETLWPGYWERYNCSPRDSNNGGLNAGGQALATVNVVTQVGTTTTLTSGTTATVGQSTDLVAQVSPAPTSGTIQFKDGGTDIGTPVTIVNGVATLPHTFTTAGSHSITAAYDGVLEFLGSTSSAQTVNVAAPNEHTSTSVTVPASAVEQTSVELNAYISPATDGGTVQFKDGGIDIGGAIPVTAGAAKLGHTFTTTGAHSITRSLFRHCRFRRFDRRGADNRDLECHARHDHDTPGASHREQGRCRHIDGNREPATQRWNRPVQGRWSGDRWPGGSEWRNCLCLPHVHRYRHT